MKEMPEDLRLDHPGVEDGAAIWRIARDSRTLDLNSSYSYLLWCRDFAGDLRGGTRRRRMSRSGS